MKRVLMTSDTVGGVWTYSLELARALGSEGVSTTIATMGAPLSADQFMEAASVPKLSVEESRFKLEWMPEPWEDVDRAGDWLVKLERELEPDIVQLNGYAHGALPWEAPTVMVAHSCVLSWWQAVYGEDAPEDWDPYAERVGAGLRAADHVVAPTAAMLSSVQQHYGPLLRASVIPNCREMSGFTPAPKEPFILSVGRLWDDAKNVRLLDEIAPSLPWPVYLAGEGYGAQHATQIGRRSSEDIAHWLGRASIYALPARYEPFGLSVLEAAMSECALVLGDIPSLRENWEGAAVFLPANDQDAWISSLRNLAEDPGAVEMLAAAARSRAKRFDPRLTGRAYLGLYEECLNEAVARKAVML